MKFRNDINRFYNITTKTICGKIIGSCCLKLVGKYLTLPLKAQSEIKKLRVENKQSERKKRRRYYLL